MPTTWVFDRRIRIYRKDRSAESRARAVGRKAEMTLGSAALMARATLLGFIPPGGHLYT
ncbi:MAG: hypothetical protein ABSE35_16715 [Bryobacteraceae bacterium]|jgi:hypothetical protein